MADSEFEREMAEAIENAEIAEVVCVILPMINQCLVFDSRATENDPPIITVSAPLGSADRRLRHVNRARPHLPHAHALAVIPWHSSIQSLVDSLVWEMLFRRITLSGSSLCLEQCSDALEELKQFERQAMVSMIRGQGPYHTIWSRSST
ncbi:MAG: hypothetical protein CL743_02205 [Chloroflexi bacterium]|nr:hypothetical protein [Chloroflexota bacterium]MBN85925.1 hypothetical protein [Dehalococcoidia bacterium]|tara:strand:- start:1005 stop:1451 length:447 start_codon:yes stop_codon:yes gene_type:complete